MIDRQQGRAVYVSTTGRKRRTSPPGRHAGAPRQVRIIGGAWKRTPLPVAVLPGLRPTPDRVRATLFNWLAHLRPDFAALRGLDLFAGTGALGFEFASRGAARVTLVEREPLLLEQLRTTRSRLAATRIEILAGDALAATARLPRAAFDVVFLDPPFDAGLLEPALAAIVPLLAPGALVYVEAAAARAGEQVPAPGYRSVRSGRAGRVAFDLLARADA
jgi:16S rRNA (guanine(966)-N(2))-methyltransferase RsmD